MIRLLSILVLAVTNVWFYARVMRPLQRLSRQARQLSAGDLTALERSCSGVEALDTLRSAMNAMVGHLRRAQAQERTYIAALTNGQEAERSRIARELHDDTVQSLIAIAQSLEIIQSQLGEETAVQPLLAAARDQAVETALNLRRLIANLRPPVLADLGLVPALRMLAESTADAEVSVQVHGPVRRLNETVELALFRGAQEAIQNARRHGQATQIGVQVTFTPDETRLVVRDNGAGFEVPAEFETLPAQGHYGLVGMRERIEHLDGTMEVVSRIGSGTRLVLSVPARQHEQPDGVVRDPVCSAVLVPDEAYASIDYQGQRYYVCCPVCEGAFRADPELYLTRVDPERAAGD